MEKTTRQIEKNVSASFGYVKKDMLMLNDAFSDLHDKMQHLSMNHAALLEEIGRLRSQIAKLSEKKSSTKKVVKKVKRSDDLTKIEGVGPAISRLLKRGGIRSYNDLSKTKVSELRKMLDDGGSKFQMHNPSSWPRQAKLAAANKWNELGKLQERLDGGVVVKKK